MNGDISPDEGTAHRPSCPVRLLERLRAKTLLPHPLILRVQIIVKTTGDFLSQTIVTSQLQRRIQEVAELGAISFEKPGLVDHLRDGSQPRKFSVLLPALDYDGAPVPHKVDPYDPDSDMVRKPSGVTFFQGQYQDVIPLLGILGTTYAPTMGDIHAPQ